MLKENVSQNISRASLFSWFDVWIRDQRVDQILLLFLLNFQQVGGGSLNCLEFGDSKLSSVESCSENTCSCPCQHGRETPDTPDSGQIRRQLSPQSINAVMAFSVVSPEIKQAIDSVKYIAENMRSRNKAKEVSLRYTVASAHLVKCWSRSLRKNQRSN